MARARIQAPIVIGAYIIRTAKCTSGQARITAWRLAVNAKLANTAGDDVDGE